MTGQDDSIGHMKELDSLTGKVSADKEVIWISQDRVEQDKTGKDKKAMDKNM